MAKNKRRKSWPNRDLIALEKSFFLALLRDQSRIKTNEKGMGKSLGCIRPYVSNKIICFPTNCCVIDTVIQYRTSLNTIIQFYANPRIILYFGILG